MKKPSYGEVKRDVYARKAVTRGDRTIKKESRFPKALLQHWKEKDQSYPFVVFSLTLKSGVSGLANVQIYGT